ncbi:MULTISPECIES: hypothetical protein [unclassified Streptomyces]|uniref:hypothetical protein n=1 Tax=unclassified Streptomyces TaxID=2593676 RepID=UPI00037FE68A|nr:hypothetical protein [Streptomyces sp. LaPpAH-202]MYW61330.1 hypothetical protein [Streptomyces sp. SID8370]MYW87277.1 hypothetical protein [Streptomyces sp. SID8371]
MSFVTIGGVTVGICILIYALVGWFPGVKQLRKQPLPHLARLLPFLVAWAYGVLAILTAGGVVGWVAGGTLWISNWLGDVALVWGVGGTAGQSAGAQTFVPLTQTGAAVVLILTVALLAALKKSKYASDLKMGAWCGVCLGTSAGVAGFAAVPLAMAVNAVGQYTYGVFA